MKRDMGNDEMLRRLERQVRIADRVTTLLTAGSRRRRLPVTELHATDVDPEHFVACLRGDDG